MMKNPLFTVLLLLGGLSLFFLKEEQIQAELTITKKNQDKSIIFLNKRDLLIEITEDFKQGKYNYKNTMQTEEGNWQSNGDFNIKEKEAIKLNKASVDQVNKRSLNWIVVAGIYIVTLVFLSTMLIGNRKKKSLNKDVDI
ncbi:DUF3324 domain-containing protein [Bacillus cereus]|nr:DUF3324 domain-containing protein [Bacillus cereus]